jgi:hypothetical protein
MFAFVGEERLPSTLYALGVVMRSYFMVVFGDLKKSIGCHFKVVENLTFIKHLILSLQLVSFLIPFCCCCLVLPFANGLLKLLPKRTC